MTAILQRPCDKSRSCVERPRIPIELYIRRYTLKGGTRVFINVHPHLLLPNSPCSTISINGHPMIAISQSKSLYFKGLYPEPDCHICNHCESEAPTMWVGSSAIRSKSHILVFFKVNTLKTSCPSGCRST